ncbi:MBL fold metallo-hydrolase [Parvularcula bermudensis]|uniref:MBL fold metallo-hydrolase n=1 Tax=Parvularcula bermudensis TaxID=208216 RepID=UPI00059F5A80
MRVRATILGCGSSGGVPRVGGADGRGDWGVCDPSNPKNRRRRCSLLVQRAHDTNGWEGELTTVLIDTSPDLREQLLGAAVNHLDGVFITHDHADQTHGIDDLRGLVYRNGKRVPVHFSDQTAPNLMQRFAYCFQSSAKTGYPAILDSHRIAPGAPVTVSGPSGDIVVEAALLDHGRVPAFGYKLSVPEQAQGGIAYSPDTNGVPDTAMALFTGVDVWVVDALRREPHPSHAHLAMALEWLVRADASRGVLTNLHIDLDYEELAAELPENVVPAYDGLCIEVPQQGD